MRMYDVCEQGGGLCVRAWPPTPVWQHAPIAAYQAGVCRDEGGDACQVMFDRCNELGVDRDRSIETSRWESVAMANEQL